MVLCLFPNSKGEVIVGFGEKISIIVDDIFRKHHIFHAKHVIEDKNEDSTHSQVQEVIFSRSSKLFAALANEKFVLIWKRILGSETIYDTWDFHRIIGPFKKNLLFLEITPNDENVIFCDVAGNVYCYHIETKTEGLLFTCISTILSMSICHNGRFIATGDRDARIRITKFPNNCEIESFCVGHNGPITSLLFTKTFLISGSFDGVVKIWDYHTSKCISSIDLALKMDIENPVVQAIHHHCRIKRIAVVVKKSYKILWFDYNKTGTVEATFVCELPIQLNIISSCWDFHGLFWVGSDNNDPPIVMFFIDLEMPKVDYFIKSYKDICCGC
uniref:tRNA (Guanine-N(7)-)-methyltransferase non-catalytic subunit WDR4 (Trinotate prediction) n=1 Tax=Henneguya salminicola TaxID=69463 RepID=A0A6G3MFM2_HENSL